MTTALRVHSDATTPAQANRTGSELLPGVSAETAAEALRLLLADSRSEATRRAYESDLRDFFCFAGQPEGRVPMPGMGGAVAWLCGHDAPGLALLLNTYRAKLRERGLSEATTNRRLSAVRALLRFARRLGMNVPDPAGLVKSEKVTAYRDTRGPELTDAARLLAAPDRATLRGKRDYALMLLLCENALRRGEVHRCDTGDFRQEEGRLWIYGKGKGTQKEPVTLSAHTVTALQEYLSARREAGETLEPAAPLFATHGRGTRTEDERLSAWGVAYVVSGYGEKALGRKVRPHQLRHMAITAVLDATGGDVRTAQKLSRHKDVRTLMIYDDARRDAQGAATRLLSGLLQAAQEEAEAKSGSGRKQKGGSNDGKGL